MSPSMLRTAETNFDSVAGAQSSTPEQPRTIREDRLSYKDRGLSICMGLSRGIVFGASNKAGIEDAWRSNVQKRNKLGSR
jgi:hypothetical protein